MVKLFQCLLFLKQPESKSSLMMCKCRRLVFMTVNDVQDDTKVFHSGESNDPYMACRYNTRIISHTHTPAHTRTHSRNKPHTGHAMEAIEEWEMRLAVLGRPLVGDLTHATQQVQIRRPNV